MWRWLRHSATAASPCAGPCLLGRMRDVVCALTVEPSMRRLSPSSYLLVLAISTLTACSDSRTASVRALGPAQRDEAVEESPDSGLTLVYASDGIDGIDAGRS